MSVEQITNEALSLSETQRASLAHALLRSLEGEPDESVEEAWADEVDRRLELVLQGKATGRPAEDVFNDLRARLQG